MLNLALPAISGLLLMTRLDKSPETTANLHIAFVASCMYCTLALMWISQVVARKQDKTTFVGDPRPGQENGQVMTKHDYDVAKLREMFTSYLSGVAMASVMHFVMGENRVLMMSAVYNPFTIIESQLFRIHLLGESDQDLSMQRPFQTPSLFPTQRRPRQTPPAGTAGAAANAPGGGAPEPAATSGAAGQAAGAGERKATAL